MESVVKRSARAIVIDDERRLVVVKRIKHGTAPYWTAPGGGVEPEDPSVEAALVRELREELGAEVDSIQQVFLVSNPVADGVGVQHFFVAVCASSIVRSVPGLSLMTRLGAVTLLTG